ncbi:UMP kinase [Candidatus Nomurabacteria bacterium]|nr:UMP kinase [Candidatus Nomurabacteria bacterium]
MYKILSVGGSIIIPKTGFDVSFLKKFRKLILDQVKNGDKFILIVGGGGTARQYQDALRGVHKISDSDLDWIGIYATRFNAEMVRLMFAQYAYKEVVCDPNTKLKTNKKIIVCAGEKPGQSTDTVAVKLAKNFGSRQVFNLSNIDYAYDKDPAKFKNARRIEQMPWSDFRKIVGSKWTPGFSAPFDPIASAAAQKMGLEVAIINGTNLPNLKRALGQKSFKGSLIHP